MSNGIRIHIQMASEGGLIAVEAAKYKILGIIPARAGSKRILHKNTCSFAGKPLIVHTFDTAKKSKLLTRLIVSTDDQEVINLAHQHAVEVPFIRPVHLADDHATDHDWITHAVDELKKEGWNADYVVILRPTSPLRTAEDIDQAIQTILANKTDSVRSLTNVQHHPYWMKKLDGNIAVPFLNLEKPEEKIRSQDLPPLYRLNGVVDVLHVKNLSSDSLYGKTMGHILIEEARSLDIDTQEDLELGEYYLSQAGRRGNHNNRDGKIKVALLCARHDAHAGVVVDIMRQNNTYETVGFFDDNPSLQGTAVHGLPVLGTIKEFPHNLPSGVTHFFICTGNNEFRAQCYNLIKSHHFQLVNVIHPSAIISETATIGEGVFIGPHAVIMNNAVLGNSVIINTAATVDHDNVIEDFAALSPGCHTSGRVHIKKGAFLGTGTSVIPDVIVGENALVGAGSVVIKDVGNNQRVAGVPAQKIN